MNSLGPATTYALGLMLSKIRTSSTAVKIKESFDTDPPAVALDKLRRWAAACQSRLGHDTDHLKACRAAFDAMEQELNP